MRYLFAICLSLTTLAIRGADDAPPLNIKNHPLASRLDAHLLPALEAFRAGVVTESDAATSVKSVRSRTLAATPKSDQLLIRIDTRVNAQILEQIAATGATVVSSAPQWNSVCALATISQIDALSALGEINTIKVQPRARARQQGLSANQGDSVMHTDTLRTQYNLSGAGQIVGVMSDSVTDTSAVGKGTVTGAVPNAVVTNTKPQTDNGAGGTHDLPSSFQVVDFGPGGGTDEGEGMMEVIHDIAPSAALAFASSGNDQASMASNLLQLRTAAHCTITCDDIGFTDEPFFQDGPIGQAIATNRANGIAHFSAFGNDANQGILTTYKPINSSTDDLAYPPSGACFHDWGNGIGAFLPVTVPAGDSVTIILQWDQPFSSYNLGAGSNADLDMYLCSSTTLNVNSTLGKSESSQGTTGAPKGDPLESIDYTNNGSSAKTVYLVINHYQGSRLSSTGGNGNVMRIVFDDDGGGCLPKVAPAGGNQMSSYGHPTAQACIGVAAIYYGQPAIPENFTSKGGNFPFYFDGTGKPSAYTRFGPDIAATDGVTTYAFTGNTGFFGTSCAAPNAAAAAALLMQAIPSSPAQLLGLLQSSATDITQAPTKDPGTAMSGSDVYTGAGLINAVKAAQVLGPPHINSPLLVSGNVGSPFSYTITASGVGPITFNASSIPAGLALSGATISGIPTSPGTFMIAISASNSSGTDNQTLQVNVGGPVPVTIVSGPGAAPNPTPIGTSTTFSVNATGSGRGLTYTWNFGDSLSAVGNPVSHQYAALGTYTASVSILDANGQSASGQVVVTVVSPPIVFTQQPSANPNPAFTTVAVQFSAAVSGGVPPLTYAWTFGDGGTSTTLNATHTYTVAGPYTAALTVKDSIGQSATASVVVNVAAFTSIVFNSPPSATPNPCNVGQSVSFSVGVSANGAVAYAWDFGDGATSSSASPTHAFAATGAYTVKLTVSDATQQTLTASVTVTVTGVPVAVVGPGPDSDGDGVSDSIEQLAGTDPNDPNSTPIIDINAPPTTLTITRMQVRLNLSRPGSDSIGISGLLPIPAHFSPSGQTLVYIIGGITGGLTLDQRGRAFSGNAQLVLQFKQSHGFVPAQLARFTLALTHGSFGSLFPSGSPSRNRSVSIPIQFIFNGVLFQTAQQLMFTTRSRLSAYAR